MKNHNTGEEESEMEQRRDLFPDNRGTGAFAPFALFKALALCLLFLLLFSLFSSLQAKEITVRQGGGGDYETISDALIAAAPGDILLIAAGLYEEKILLKEGVTLRGEGKGRTRVRFKGQGPVVFAKGIKEARLENMAFTYGGEEKHSIVLVAASQVTIENCLIYDGPLSGLEVAGSSSVNLLKSEVKGNRGSGLYFYKGSMGEVAESRISGNRFHGMEVKKGASLLVKKSAVTDNGGGGLYMHGKGKVTLAWSFIEGNGAGGVLLKEGEGKVLNNTIAANSGSGLFIAESVVGEGLNNVLIRNDIGIKGKGGKNFKLSHNSLWGNIFDYRKSDKSPGDFQMDPLVDANFRIKRGSPLIGSGFGGVDRGAFPLEKTLVLEAGGDQQEPVGDKVKPEEPPAVAEKAGDPCQDAVEAYNAGVALSDYSDEEAHFYDKAIALCPDYYKAHYNLGLLHKKKGREKEAVTAFREVLRIKPDFAEGYQNLGTLYYQKGELKEARDLYMKAITLQPGKAASHFNLGGVYWAMKEYALARQEMLKTLEIKPDHAFAQGALEKINKKLETE